MINNLLSQFCSNRDITLTPLRQDILEIIYSDKHPLGAYDILNKLKTKRPNAEPPTVYRVLEFLIQAKLIHRIESQNTYVSCSHLSESEQLHLAILLFCKKCRNSFEFEDKNIVKSLKKLAENNSLEIDSSVIEIQGTCKKCMSSTVRKSKQKNKIA